LSRGARLAVAVDGSRDAIAALRSNATTLGATGLEVRETDALAFLRADPRQFDVVFLDPPFREPWLERLWAPVAERLSAGGVVYVEQPDPVTPPAGWEVSRQGQAGRVHYHLLRLTADHRPFRLPP